MAKAEYINQLVNKWIEVYQTTDKRTIKAKEIKKTVYDLSSLIGLI